MIFCSRGLQERCLELGSDDRRNYEVPSPEIESVYDLFEQSHIYENCSNPTPISASISPPDFLHKRQISSVRRIHNSGSVSSRPSSGYFKKVEVGDDEFDIKENCAPSNVNLHLPHRDRKGTNDPKEQKTSMVPWPHPQEKVLRNIVNKCTLKLGETVLYTPNKILDMDYGVQPISGGHLGRKDMDELYITTLFNGAPPTSKASVSGGISKIKEDNIPLLSDNIDAQVKVNSPSREMSTAQSAYLKSLYLSDEICSMLGVEVNPYRQNNNLNFSFHSVPIRKIKLKVDNIRTEPLNLSENYTESFPHETMRHKIDATSANANDGTHTITQENELLSRFRSVSIEGNGIFLKEDSNSEQDHSGNGELFPAVLEPKTTLKFHHYYKLLNKEPVVEVVDPITQILTAPGHKSPRKPYHYFRRYKNHRVHSNADSQNEQLPEENRRSYHRTRWWLNFLEPISQEGKYAE